jgi:manganese-dependent inorganic pyrophosphatase
MIKVFGHKPADTDTTCSPIVYAWYLSEKRNTDAKAFRLSDINKETEFVLKRFGIEKPELLEKLKEGEQVIIIDTNNPDELLEGINDVEILEIIDHHKLAGGLSTPAPLKVTVRPVACSATILWDMFNADGNTDLPKEMAGLLLSAILSDTLKFTSPTTTEDDKKAAEELAQIAEVNIDKYADEMFAAKSDLSGMGAKEVLMSDSKLFDLKGKKVRIGVLETTKPENALAMKEDILKEMENIKSEESLDAHFFSVVDILNSASDMIILGDLEKEIAEKAFNCQVKDNQTYLDGIVSRKKQMIPNIEGAIG